jgi:O-antigen ligase
MTERMGARIAAGLFAPARAARVAEWLAVAIAISLPWSTSATGILTAAWLVAFVPTVRLAELRRELADPAAGLPVLLCALMLLGVAWSVASPAAALGSAKAYLKLLVIPLLIIQFRRSAKGYWVLGAFLASCTALLVLSWIHHAWPVLAPRGTFPGVPVKNYIVQNMEFVICAFACGHLAIGAWRRDHRPLALALAALAFAFLINAAFVVTARTTLVTFPVLLVLLAVQGFGWRGAVGALALGGVFVAVIWAASPHLRMRTLAVVEEVHQYRQDNAETSSGYRLAFWRSSIAFVSHAPIAGQGTGAIEPLFRAATAGQSGAAGTVTSNAHNQTLEIAIQLGLIGVSLLYAVWIAHILMFWKGGLAAWLGLGVVLQGVIGSLFLSYLTDFSTGWLYVLGVGVLGGMVAAERDKAVAAPASECRGAPAPAAV